MCSTHLCNTELEGPSQAPWRHPKGFIEEESNCSKYTAIWRTTPRRFSNHTWGNCVKEVWQQGRCLHELISSVLQYLWKSCARHWILRARICFRHCFTPGSGLMPWTVKVFDRWLKASVDGLWCGPLTLIFLLNCSCTMTILVWVIQCTDMLSMSAQVWNGSWSFALGEAKSTRRSHSETKGGTEIKCCARNKYEKLSTGESGE